MKRGLSTALALAAALNLLVGLTAADGPAPQPVQEPSADEAQGGRTVTSPVVIGGGQPAKSEEKQRDHHKRRAKTTGVKAAGAGSVTIKDFSYAPKSVTVNVGDTVTWVNNGPTAHTATANNGSFDTGTLKKGQSGSHTFTKAGTFSYFCTLHPFMKASVVVAAAGGSGGSSGSSGPSGPTGSSGGGAGNAPSEAAAGRSSSKSGLPPTGVDVGSLLLSGVLLLGSGLVLRRRAADSSR